MDTEEQVAELLRYGRCNGSHCKGKGIAQESHTCPYAEEIGNDLTECNCCDLCTGDCAMDI